MTRKSIVWTAGLWAVCAVVSYRAWCGPGLHLTAADEAPVFDTLPAPAHKPAVRGEVKRKTQKSGAPASNGVAKTVSRPLVPIDRHKPLDQYLPVESEVDVGLMTFARAGEDPTEADYENFASLMSAEYRATTDSIAKHRLLESIKQQLREKLAALKANPYFVVTRDFYLEHYDVHKHAFPLVQTQGIPVSWLMEGRISYFARTTSYVLRISNAKDFADYPVDEEQAQELEARPPVDRSGQGLLYLFARDTEPGNRTVRAEIVTARLYDKGKDLIAELGGR